MIQSALRVSYTSPKVMHWITQLLIWLSAESCKHTCDEDMTKYDAVAEAIAQKAVKENFFDVCKDGAFAMGVNTPHIVFNYLDFLIWNGNRKKYDNFDFEFRNSVEHWYPQNPSEGTFAQWKDGVDQFGNLCIIQRNVNSKFSNMSPEAKKSTFRDMKCSCGCKFNQRGWNHHNGADEMAFQCYSKLAHGSVTERKKRGLPTKDTCTTPIIPKWKMELIAHEIFTKHFTDISAVTELACKMIEEHINDVEDVEDNTEIIAQKNAEIEKLERKKVGLIEMRADGDIERDYFLMRKDEVEKKIECLRQEIQELTPIDTRQKKENLVERLEALKQKLSEYTDFENTLIIPDGVIEAFTEQIIASDKGFDWYLKAVPDMVKSFMDDTPDDETEKEWHELTQFDLTIEDAKAYVYSFSSRRRVHGWQNIKIRLFV